MQSQADSLRTAQADLERLRTPTPPTPPVPPTPPTPKGGDTALLAAITALTEKVNSFEESKNKDTLQGQNDALKASAKAKMLLDGATSDMADKILGGINVIEGATLESIHAEGMKDYNFFKTNLAPEAGSPGAPNGNPDGTVTKSTRESYFADRKAKLEEQAKN
jgi:hypothetical protein